MRAAGPQEVERGEPGGEVSQRRRLEGDPVSRQPVRLGGHGLTDLDHVVDVALGVRPARDGQPDQVHARRVLAAVGMPAEHHRADLARPDAAGLVERHRQGLPGVGQRRDVRQQRARVQVDRVPTDRLQHRDPVPDQRIAEVRGGLDPVAQVVVVDHLPQPLGQRLEVTPGQTAVGREPLGQDQQGVGPLGQGVVVQGQPAADVAHRVLLGAHRHAVGQAGHLADDVGHRPLALALLALPDEPGVLREAAGVQEERLVVAVAQRPDRPQVLQRHRLAAAAVVGHRHHHAGHVVRPLGQQHLQGVHVEVALERVPGPRIPGVRGDQVGRRRAGVLDVGPGGVEVGVARHHLARPAEQGEQDPLGRPALVGGDHVREGEQLLHGLLEDRVRGGAGVRLVAVLDRRPLVPAHRPGAGVGEQVDQHVLGPQLEEVVVGGGQMPAALGLRGQPHRLDRVDPERLDDGAELAVAHGPTVSVRALTPPGPPFQSGCAGSTPDGPATRRTWQ